MKAGGQSLVPQGGPNLLFLILDVNNVLEGNGQPFLAFGTGAAFFDQVFMVPDGKDFFRLGIFKEKLEHGLVKAGGRQPGYGVIQNGILLCGKDVQHFLIDKDYRLVFQYQDAFAD